MQFQHLNLKGTGSTGGTFRKYGSFEVEVFSYSFSVLCKSCHKLSDLKQHPLTSFTVLKSRHDVARFSVHGLKTEIEISWAALLMEALRKNLFPNSFRLFAEFHSLRL